MCGIAGYVGTQLPSDERVQATLKLMVQRGPDHQAARRIKLGKLDGMLLHSRLSIIDLDAEAHQPFVIGDTTLAFNGEIYNYKEERQALEQQGVRFKTSSDTEVLLQSYLKRGGNMFDALEGMWSFALHDAKQKKLLLSRDRFGEKPLYYLKLSHGIVFASETRFLSALSGTRLRPNLRHLSRYVVNGYKALYKTDDTFYEDVREFPRASYAFIDENLRMDVKRYWDPRVIEKRMSYEAAVEGFRGRFLKSMELRLRSDVPMAFCLSGGVDSAAIVSTAAKVFKYDVATFSIIDKDPRYNEAGNIEATVRDLKCKNTRVHITPDKSLHRLKNLIQYHDAPIATISYYVHSFLSEAIQKAGYRLVASGTGADELVTGYFDHFTLHLHAMRGNEAYASRLEEWKEHVLPVVRNPFLQDPELYDKDPDFRGHVYLDNERFATCLKGDFTEDFREERYSDNLLKNRMQNELFNEVIPVILHEDDLNSMRCSIENRSPYLDRELYEFSHSIPAEHLIRGGYAKSVLRDSMRGILNDTVRLDRQKKGFNASIHSVIDFKDKNIEKEIFSDSPVYDFLDRDKLRSLISYDGTPNSVSKFMFNFLNVKIFIEMNA